MLFSVVNRRFQLIPALGWNADTSHVRIIGNMYEKIIYY